MIGTLTADGWAVTFGTARKETGRDRSPPRRLLAAPNVTAHQSVFQLRILRCGTIIAIEQDGGRHTRFVEPAVFFELKVWEMYG